ncbi:MAG: hypothetical protein MI919_13020 [Holophagales bacterium]|nr:hypothetical protein [Holophagales bacterium]
MKTLLDRLERAWFIALPPSRLAIVRIVVGAYALYYVGTRRDMLATLASSADFLFRPVGVFRVFDAPISPELFGWMVDSTLVLGILFVLGWQYRIVGPVFALLLLAVFSYRNSWSMIYHSHNPLVLHALVLGVARAADALSIDAWRRRGAVQPKDSSHWRYGWPIQLICLTTVSIYFLAGVAKVASQLGWAWAGGGSLRDQIAVDAIRKDVFGGYAPPLAFTLYDFVWLFTILGIGSLIIELGAPLALAARRWAYAWVLMTWSLHWGIFFIMDIKFRYQLSGLVFVAFLPMEMLFRRRQEEVEPGREPPGIAPAGLPSSGHASGG